MFRKLVGDYPEIVFPTAEASDVEVDRLYIDANSMIHPCIRGILGDLRGKTIPTDLQDRFNTAFTTYLQNVIDIVQPRSLLYISVDGPAPRAKMNQQRDRRYKSAKMRRLSDAYWDTLGLPNNKSVFDTNAITPGTVFMSKLMRHIQDYFRKARTIYDTILSSSNVPGEGEHKIMSYIRKNPCTETQCIYGLDADLIFLSLSTGLPNMILVREHVYLSNKEEKEETASFDYLSIDRLREGIIKDSLERTRCKFDGTKVVRDYVFICFFLGNDFLPHLPSLSIQSGGLDAILKHYYGILRNSDKHLVFADGGINVPFLKKFLGALAAEEDRMLYEDNQRRQQHRYHVQYRQDPSKTLEENKHDEYMYKQDIVYRTENDEVYYGTKGWKWRYWMRYFGVNPHFRPKEYDEVRYKVVLDYFKGIQWTKYYYNNDLTDWHWYYTHEAGPTLSDLVEFIDKVKLNSMKTEKTKPVKPFEQLMMVLPRTSSDLLPKSYAQIMTSLDSPVGYCYPVDFKVHAARKIHYGECTARLPIIDENELSSALKGSRLTQTEKERNTLEKKDNILSPS